MDSKHLITIAFVFISSFLSAQSVIHPLDSIVIRENRIPETYGRYNRNVEILTKKEIKNLPVKTVNELLSYVSGVDLRQRGPAGVQSDVGIDGSSFDQVLVLINGVKMTDPQTGHHIMNLPIPLAAIQQIEVLRGPAARIYGVNALAGAINIITGIPQENTVFAQAYTGSDFHTDSASGKVYTSSGLQAGISLTGKQHAHLLSLAHDRGMGYRYNTDFRTSRFYYQNQINLDKKNTLHTSAGYIHNDFGANSFYAAPNDKDAVETVQTFVLSLADIYRLNDKINIKPRISYRYNNDDYIYVKQDPELYHNIHITQTLTAEVQTTIQLKNGVLGGGMEYRDEKINSSNLGNNQRGNIGLFAEYKHYFSEKFNINAGVYLNKNSIYDWSVFPGLDIGYYPVRQLKFFINTTSGQRLPTYTDMYYKGPANIGNPELKPEHAYYIEGGMKYYTAYLTTKTVYFYRQSKDFIDWVRHTTNDPWQPQNFQTIHTQGLALQLDYDVAKHAHLPDNIAIKANVNYTYLSPQINHPNLDDSKYIIDALRHQVIFKLVSSFHDKLNLSCAYRYLHRVNNNDYSLLDARLAYRIRPLQFYVDVNNILNTQYREIGAVPLPQRWFTFGIRLDNLSF